VADNHPKLQAHGFAQVGQRATSLWSKTGNRLPGRKVDDYLKHGYCAGGKDKYDKDITCLLRARTVFSAIGGIKGYSIPQFRFVKLS